MAMRTAVGAGPDIPVVALPSGRLDGWRGLAALGAAGILLALVTFTVLVGEVVPPAAAGALVFAAGIVLTARHPGRAGPLLIGLASLGLLLSNSRNLAYGLTVPNDVVDFGLSALILLGAACGVAGAVPLARPGGVRVARSLAPRVLGGGAGALAVLAVVASAVLRLGVPDAVAQAGDLTVESQGLTFTTTSLRASAGTVAVAYANPDPGSHTFTIDALGVDLVVPGGTTGRAQFDAPAGTYRFYCAVPAHRPTMHGTLTVG
jgi:plastocyanin